MFGTEIEQIISFHVRDKEIDGYTQTLSSTKFGFQLWEINNQSICNNYRFAAHAC